MSYDTYMGDGPEGEQPEVAKIGWNPEVDEWHFLSPYVFDGRGMRPDHAVTIINAQIVALEEGPCKACDTCKWFRDLMDKLLEVCEMAAEHNRNEVTPDQLAQLMNPAGAS